MSPLPLFSLLSVYPVSSASQLTHPQITEWPNHYKRYKISRCFGWLEAAEVLHVSYTLSSNMTSKFRAARYRRRDCEPESTMSSPLSVRSGES